MLKKVWVVTGSSRGIGLALTKKLIEMGHSVLGLSRTCPDLNSAEFIHLPIDLEKTDSIHQKLFLNYAIQGAIFSHGLGIFRNLEEFSDHEIFKLFSTNLLSTILMTKILLPQLKKQSQSHLIYLGSEAGLSGKSRSTIYSATKFGLRGFCQSIRKECAKTGVKITLLQPGLTRTSFYESLDFEPKSDEKCAIHPDDLANLLPLILNASVGTCFEELLITPQANAIQFKN